MTIYKDVFEESSSVIEQATAFIESMVWLVPEVKVVGFDLDGTLADVDDPLVRMVTSNLVLRGLLDRASGGSEIHPISSIYTDNYAGDGKFSTGIEAVGGRFPDRGVSIENIRSEARASVPWQTLLKVQEGRDFIIRLIKTLHERKYIVDLITESNRTEVKSKLEGLGLSQSDFTLILSADDMVSLNIRKGDGSVYEYWVKRRILEEKAANMREFVYIGNEEEKDVKAARERGITTIKV